MPVPIATIRPLLHPLHAILLSFPIALFTTALANDIVYLNTAEMQWSNFAAWAIVGALVFGAPVILWTLIKTVRYRVSASRGPGQGHARGRLGTALVLLVVMWVAGLIDAFQHSRDAWSSVGIVGVLLSTLATACALAAGWIAYSAGSIDTRTEGAAR